MEARNPTDYTADIFISQHSRRMRRLILRSCCVASRVRLQMPVVRPQGKIGTAGECRPIIFVGYGSRGRDFRSSSSPRYVAQLKLAIHAVHRLLSMRLGCCHCCVVIAKDRSITSRARTFPIAATPRRFHRSFLTKSLKGWKTVAEFSPSAQASTPFGVRDGRSG